MARKMNILLIEDNNEDVRMTRETLSESDMVNRLDVIQDGELAFELVQGLTEDNRPDLILLDLYLPKRTGFEIIVEIQANPALRNVPVVVLTASTANEMFLQRFNIRPTACLSKPIEMSELSKITAAVAA